ncbi:hypothetical protein VI03_30990 [Burkholderia vietnamiensis]|nr:hypothetical protein VI03_30990 [Burkholderia vietnamiensis]
MFGSSVEIVIDRVLRVLDCLEMAEIPTVRVECFVLMLRVSLDDETPVRAANQISTSTVKSLDSFEHCAFGVSKFLSGLRAFVVFRSEAVRTHECVQEPPEAPAKAT